MFADLFLKDKPMSFAQQNFRNEFLPSVIAFNNGVNVLSAYATEESDIQIGQDAILFLNFGPVVVDDDVQLLNGLGFTFEDGAWRY
jgi:hypothetical protein